MSCSLMVSSWDTLGWPYPYRERAVIVHDDTAVVVWDRRVASRWAKPRCWTPPTSSSPH